MQRRIHIVHRSGEQHDSGRGSDRGADIDHSATDDADADDARAHDVGATSGNICGNI